MSHFALPDLGKVNEFIGYDDGFVFCKYCHKTFNGDPKNRRTVAREHVRKHISRAEIVLGNSASDGVLLSFGEEEMEVDDVVGNG